MLEDDYLPNSDFYSKIRISWTLYRSSSYNNKKYTYKYIKKIVFKTY